MAIIQNSAIIQKIVDELELSPATEKVPTELAEKILPVFQVNSEEVEAIIKPNYVMWQDIALNDSDKTLTVPDEHTYVIKYGMILTKTTATVGNRTFVLWVKDKAGIVVWMVEMGEQVASKDWYNRLDPATEKYQAGGGAVSHLNKLIPIPQDFVLKEGYTFQVVDEATIDAAADDVEISLMVEDILD